MSSNLSSQFDKISERAHAASDQLKSSAEAAKDRLASDVRARQRCRAQLLTNTGPAAGPGGIPPGPAAVVDEEATDRTLATAKRNQKMADISRLVQPNVSGVEQIP